MIIEIFVILHLTDILTSLAITGLYLRARLSEVTIWAFSGHCHDSDQIFIYLRKTKLKDTFFTVRNIICSRSRSVWRLFSFLVALCFLKYSDISHLRNHFSKMSLNQFLIQGDLSCVSGASFLYKETFLVLVVPVSYTSRPFLC